MIRMNLHIDEDFIKELDSISNAISAKLAETNVHLVVSRSDLIRFALSRTFRLPYPSIHIKKEDLWDLIRLVRLNLQE